ncbi:hypothetical protein LY90DRAFT_504520 [Neocallimastix californiae]|uniref:Clu domain-containing protein n=1 Tax=Neocallimastix californiae TaxID=1754190 RepID=A0A1Y2E8G4_9FUNG|nr:hypothetical protein LY90DRAFT_504520 [Neocallimastix californiae]|eukprot:ORY67839.1 hypothetical protein LY90DRAFT_504520 [Neocallimastix californiae]
MVKEISKEVKIESQSIQDNQDFQQEETEKAEVDSEKLYEVEILLPSNLGSFKIPVSSHITINEIKQYIWDAPEAKFYTCFNLFLNGEKLNNFSNIESDFLIQNFDKIFYCFLKYVILKYEDRYTEKDVRFHLIKMLEVLKGYKNEMSFGLMPSQTFFSSIVDSTLEEEKEKEKEEESDKEKDKKKLNNNNSKKGKKNKKNKKSKSDSNNKASTEDEYSSILSGVLDEVPKLSDFLPKNYNDSTIKCYLLLTLSSWNPVTTTRKINGDLMYLKVITLENKTYQITASVNGFFVNRSTDVQFNPLMIHDSRKFDTLSALLCNISPLYKMNLEKHLDNLKNKLMYEYVPVYPEIYPWMVKSGMIEPAQNLLENVLNNSNTLETYGVRNWNDEFKAVRAMPNNEVQEILLRDQSFNRVQIDFVAAATKGAVDAVNGNLISLNQGESIIGEDGKESNINIFIHNGIFYTCGYDEFELFESLGGSEAAHVAIGKDIEGINILNNAEIDGISSLSTIAVDYLGRRVVAQVVAPEIINKTKDTSIMYGSSDHGKTVLFNNNVHEKLKNAAKALHLEEHDAINCGDDDYYLLDLYRLTPVDIEFLDEADKEKENPYPHRLTLIRPELIALYIQHKFSEYINKLNESAPKQEEGKEINEEELLKQRISQEELNEKVDIRFNNDCFVCESEEKDEKLLKQEENVRELSKFISAAVIPGFIVDLTENKISPVDGENLTSIMHQRGINMRYLGKISKLIEETSENKLHYYNKIIVDEMVTRTTKHILNKALRNITIDHASQCISHILNCLYVKSYAYNKKDSYDFYKITNESLWTEIKEDIKKRFRYELHESYILDRKIPVLKALCKCIGFQIEMRDYDFYNSIKVFSSSDIINIYPVVKAPKLKVKYAQYAQDNARSFLAKGNIQAGLELFNEAQLLYEQTHGPINQNIANCCQEIALIYSIQDGEENKKLARDYQQKAIIIFERTIGVDHSETIMQYFNLAYYEFNLGNIKKALYYIKHALYHWNLLKKNELHPNDTNVLKSIASILRNIKCYELSLQFYKLVLNANKLFYGNKHLMTGLSYHQVTQSYCFLNDFKSAVNSETNTYKILSEEFGENDERTLASKNLLTQLKNRNVKDEELNANSNDIGSLPIEDLMKYISGEVSYKSMSKLAKNKNKTSTN